MNYTYLLILFCFPYLTFGQSSETSDYLSRWENTVQYTIRVIEAMPAEKFHLSPNPEVKPFADELMHMMDNMVWLSTAYLTSQDFEKQIPESKEAFVQYLNEISVFVKGAIKTASSNYEEEVNFFAGPMSKRKVVLLLFDHLTHHRGQLTIYLRLHGIKPPRYIGW